MPLRILPSSMSVLAICAGLTSIRFALEGQPHVAIALIAAAAILDGLDGRVARILDAESRMGEEIDSLADAVNFGVAPAVVVYVSLLPSVPAGWVVVLLYAVSIVLRLARFNALLDDATQPAFAREFFVGIPAPAGAISALGPLAAKLQFGAGWWTSPWFVCAWVAACSMLVVSRIPMRKMHAVSVPPNLAALLLAALAIVAAAAFLFPYILIMVLIAAYLLLHSVLRSQLPLAGGASRGVGRKTQAAARHPTRDPPGAAQPPVDGAVGPAQAHRADMTAPKLTLTARLEHLGRRLPPRRRPTSSQRHCRPWHSGVGRGVADRIADHDRGRRHGRRANPGRHRAAGRRDAVQRRSQRGHRRHRRRRNGVRRPVGDLERLGDDQPIGLRRPPCGRPCSARC